MMAVPVATVVFDEVVCASALVSVVQVTLVELAMAVLAAVMLVIEQGFACS